MIPDFIYASFRNYPVAALILSGFILFIGAIYLVGAIRDGSALFTRWRYRKGDTQGGERERTNIAAELENFLYYRSLPITEKKRFIDKTLVFLSTKSIEGTEDYTPGESIRIRVAAAATQLTFGLTDFLFPGFDTIRLYSAAFRLNESGPLMKGATTPNGIIYLSVSDFETGYERPHDKLNVGLHELAHALFLELIKERNENNVPAADFDEYLAEADRMQKEGAAENHFLRNYAFKNRHEFFAVCAEHFFEAPREFDMQLPHLYKLMTRVLKQDPSRNIFSL